MLDDPQRRDAPDTRLLRAFAAASLVAVAAGCAVAAAAGIGSVSWARSLVAWALGGALALAISRRAAPPAFLAAIVVAAIIGLAATFVDDGQDGVYRWWNLGPLHINAAALTLPLAIVALARLHGSLVFVAAASVALTGLLAAQPDASQATAFAIALSAVFVVGRHRPMTRWGIVALLAAVAGVSWLRPDPLAPVPEVEEIVQLAWQVAPIAGGLGLLGLVAAVVVPMVGRSREPGLRPDAAALSAYIAVAALAPAAGAFPVPLIGVGMSSVLGLWLGIGLLATPSQRLRAA